MKKGSNKLIIAIIVILVIAIIVVGGAYLYFTTDLFKGNEQLFFKYLAQNGQVLKELSSSNEATLVENIINNKYKEEAEMTFNVESNNTQIANQSIPAGNFNIKYSGLVDPENNSKSSETTLKYLTTDLFTLKYIRNNDLYALKSDEVVNKYLAFDNNNVKDFAKKLGITDTSLIPNKIQPTDFEELFKITKEQQKALLQKYLGVINTQISKDKYKSQKDVTITIDSKDISTTEYYLELTQDEVVRILSSILDTLKNDDITLNILVDKIKVLDSENNTTVNDLRNNIQNAIDDLNSIQTINGETIKIAVYASNGKLVRTEISGGNDIIYIDPQENDTSSRVIISFEKENELLQDQTNNANRYEDIRTRIQNSFPKIKRVELAKQIKENQNTIISIVTFKTGNETIKISTQTKTVVGDSIKENTTINVNISDNTYITASINASKVPSSDIKIEELTKQNSATINNFTPQYITTLSQAIVNRLKSLYAEKLEIVNAQINSQNMNNEDNSNTLIPNEL
ncbi:MAG: hypothetical protein HFJ58_06315 [Clostridia bacterium]|nr:hypothetical protein [Clostridia bacterium]